MAKVDYKRQDEEEEEEEEEDGACLSVSNFCRLLEEGSTNCKHFCLKVKVSPDSDTAEKVDTRGNGLNVNGLILSGLESNKREGGDVCSDEPGEREPNNSMMSSMLSSKLESESWVEALRGSCLVGDSQWSSPIPNSCGQL